MTCWLVVTFIAMACSGTSEGVPNSTADVCPGGMGESACCEGGTTLCGTSLTGESCCDEATEVCTTCSGSEDVYTTCLPIGEVCD